MSAAQHDLVIIGGGPAGLASGVYAARAGLNVLLLERLVPGGQVLITDWIENYPGFPEGVSGPDLVMKMMDQAKRFGLKIETNQVLSMDFSTPVKKLRLNDREIAAHTVIIASGASPRKLGIPGEDRFFGKGVSSCATCDGPFCGGRVVAAVGGGDTAVQESIFLSRFAEKIYLIHRRDELRAQKILRERIAANEKIEFVWDSILTEIEGENRVEAVKVKHLKTGETRRIGVGACFIWIGILPNADFIGKEIATDEFGFIVTDQNMETSVPGVFAAGDVRQVPLRQIANAVGDAVVATHSAEHYIGNVSS